jgi:hypothetical protein
MNEKLKALLKVVKTKRFIAASVITAATIGAIIAVTKGTQLVEIENPIVNIED